MLIISFINVSLHYKIQNTHIFTSFLGILDFTPYDNMLWMCVTHHSHSFQSPPLSLLLSDWFLYSLDAGSPPSPHTHTYTPLHPGFLHALSLRMTEKNRPWASCLPARVHLNYVAPFTNTAPANQHVVTDQGSSKNQQEHRKRLRYVEVMSQQSKGSGTTNPTIHPVPSHLIVPR